MGEVLGTAFTTCILTLVGFFILIGPVWDWVASW